MTMPTRRRLLGLLLSTSLATIGNRVLGGPLDQGIGGTGVVPDDETDRGIGGTGVIGTIRKFGSIVVNDFRIAYPPDAQIRIDGRPASISDLKIGQVVRVAAAGRPGAYSTRVIDVTSEVVGPVDRVQAKRIFVLGQTVSTAALKKQNVAVGDTIAVSGLRRNDGTIVASLIERRDGAPPRVSGPVRISPDGSRRIGGLPLSGVDSALVGRRAVLEGRSEGDRFVVTRGSTEAALLPPSIRTLSIESYVERRNGSLSLGSGFRVTDKGLEVPPGQSVRAVVTTTIGRDGQLTIDSVRTGGRTFDGRNPGGDRNIGHGRGGQSEGKGGRPHDEPASRPMDFGHGPPGAGRGPGGGFGGGGFRGGGRGGRR